MKTGVRADRGAQWRMSTLTWGQLWLRSAQLTSAASVHSAAFLPVKISGESQSECGWWGGGGTFAVIYRCPLLVTSVMPPGVESLQEAAALCSSGPRGPQLDQLLSPRENMEIWVFYAAKARLTEAGFIQQVFSHLMRGPWKRGADFVSVLWGWAALDHGGSWSVSGRLGEVGGTFMVKPNDLPGHTPNWGRSHLLGRISRLYALLILSPTLVWPVTAPL